MRQCACVFWLAINPVMVWINLPYIIYPHLATQQIKIAPPTLMRPIGLSTQASQHCILNYFANTLSLDIDYKLL
jgi:hypothetical protein